MITEEEMRLLLQAVWEKISDNSAQTQPYWDLKTKLENMLYPPK